MIKVEKVDTWGFNHAIRGMRNPYNSWDRSDSMAAVSIWTRKMDFLIGDADLKLMQKLYAAGPEHRKFMRQIFVSMDVVAPLYWWKEFDTYKIGVTADSCSTMHTITKKDFSMEDFSTDGMSDDGLAMMAGAVNVMNMALGNFRQADKAGDTESKEKYWRDIILMLPSSYMQRRTITMSYENAASMIRQRGNHRLTEWREFVKKLKELPWLTEIMQINEGNHENPKSTDAEQTESEGRETSSNRAVARVPGSRAESNRT